MKPIIYALLLCSTAFAAELDKELPENEISLAQKNKRPHSSKNEKTKPTFKQGDDRLPPEVPAAYNAPAGVLLRNKDDSMIPDLYFEANYLYYFAQEDGLNLATSGQIVNPSGGTNLVTAAVSNGTTLMQDFEYSSGFKLGAGYSYDEWALNGQYTWIRQTTNTNEAAPAPGSTLAGPGAWIPNNWFEQVNPTSGQSLAGSSIASEWHLGMDIADLTTGRPYYQGKNLTLSPFFGLRAAWIRQTMQVNLTTSPLLTATAATTITSNNSSNCWGIGPRTGFQGACLLGGGFRLEGDASAGLLYTVFTHANHDENSPYTAGTSSIVLNQGHYRTVRPELELGLGLGWGMYLAKERFHIDVSAGYDFSVFWGQNMIRQVLDETIAGVSADAGDLYLQGLNLSARFDF